MKRSKLTIFKSKFLALNKSRYFFILLNTNSTQNLSFKPKHRKFERRKTYYMGPKMTPKTPFLCSKIQNFENVQKKFIQPKSSWKPTKSHKKYFFSWQISMQQNRKPFFVLLKAKKNSDTPISRPMGSGVKKNFACEFWVLKPSK